LFEALHNEARVAEIKFQMARTVWKLGNRTRARRLLSEALGAANSAANDGLAVRVEAHIAWTDTEEGKYGAAKERLEQLLPRADRLADPIAQFAVRFALAKTLGSVEPTKSIELLKELATRLDVGVPRSDLAAVYNELSKVLGAQGRTDEALAYAQRAYATTTAAKGGG
jgi:tetratricopeptide (TPR) repeat protein